MSRALGVGIVVIETVRHGAVDQRGKRRSGRTTQQDRRVTGRSPGFRHASCGDSSAFGMRSERYAHPIDEAHFRVVQYL